VFDEKQFTPHGATGWQSWDEWSPEQDFCRFAGMLQRLLQPLLTLETGVGVGRLTGHLDPTVGAYLGFEADPKWRRPPAEPARSTPNAEEMARADLVILDSDPQQRIPELQLWSECGKPGSVVLVHDAGNGHQAPTIHEQIGRACTLTGQQGSFLRNPRGGWMGIHA
jgi:hypothetical protein